MGASDLYRSWPAVSHISNLMVVFSSRARVCVKNAAPMVDSRYSSNWSCLRSLLSFPVLYLKCCCCCSVFPDRFILLTLTNRDTSEVWCGSISVCLFFLLYQEKNDALLKYHQMTICERTLPTADSPSYRSRSAYLPPNIKYLLTKIICLPSNTSLN